MTFGDFLEATDITSDIEDILQRGFAKIMDAFDMLIGMIHK